MFSFCTPLMINGTAKWGVKTGFLYVRNLLALPLCLPLFPIHYQYQDYTNHISKCSFAGTGLVSVIVAWFILPEVARRTPAEIDEM